MSLTPILLMSGAWTKGLQLLASISLLVVLHEFGHYYFARLFKTRVEKFYLFFDFFFPFSGLLNFSLFKKKVGDTEFGIGWFPLGGYVKIAGMVDESMDKEALAKPPEPWEYRSKKAWQRLFIMLGGIIMNVITAVVLYVIIFGVWGEQYIPMSKVKYGIAVDSIGRSIGLRDGDRITAIDDKTIKRFNEIPIALILHDDNGTISLNRAGRDTVIKIPDGTIGKIIKAERNSIISPRYFAVIDSVWGNSLAASIGLKAKDSVVSVNGTSTLFPNDFSDYKKSHAGKPLVISYYRDGALLTATAVVPPDSLLGITWHTSEEFYHKVRYSPVAAVGRGFEHMWSTLKLYVAQLKLLRSKEVQAHKSVGGFISMGKMFKPEFHWQDFLMMTAFISIALAFMNLLPVPGLDGGYVIFLLWEIITGKQVSEKVMERATTVGLVLLLSLMVYVNGLDILKMIGLVK